MCKYIKSNKEKCKIKSKGEYCHFHKKYEIDQFKQNEIKNLNNINTVLITFVTYTVTKVV